MKIYLKLVASLAIMFLSTQLFANNAVVGEQSADNCCTECDNSGRASTANVPIDTETGQPARPAGATTAQ